MLLPLVALMLAAQKGAPAAMLADADRLRGPGRTVQVSDVEDHEWQIWLEFLQGTDDKGLDGIAGTKGLSAIRAFNGGFGDAGVAKLKDLPDLKVLVLISNKLTDECTKPISKLKGLVKLDLNQVRLTKVGLKRLEALPKLRRLYLYKAIIADPDLLALKALTKLTILDLPDTVSDATLADISSALPHTTVSRGH